MARSRSRIRKFAKRGRSRNKAKSSKRTRKRSTSSSTWIRPRRLRELSLSDMRGHNNSASYSCEGGPPVHMTPESMLMPKWKAVCSSPGPDCKIVRPKGSIVQALLQPPPPRGTRAEGTKPKAATAIGRPMPFKTGAIVINLEEQKPFTPKPPAEEPPPYLLPNFAETSLSECLEECLPACENA